MDMKLMLERAQLGGQWAITNQVKAKNSADCGRYARTADVARDTIPTLASSWLQGVQVMAMLALHEATGKQEYWDSCVAAAGYIKSLQQLDSRKPKNFGYFVEVTPQNVEGHPRDALTAAWALLMMHRADPNEDLLDRAVLFGRWFITHGMDEYPFWTVYMDGRPPFRQRGSFHGGSPAFLCDLFEMTGQSEWLDAARNIADFHMTHLLKPDGSLKITVEPDSNRDLTGNGDAGDLAWEHMHKYNDDFTALAMMKLGELTGDAKYTEAGLRFCNHLLASQQATGGFGDPIVPSASGVGAITLIRAGQVDPANAPRYSAAAAKAVEHCLSLQEIQNDNPRYYGGFYGQAERPADDWRQFYNRRVTVNLRTHAYCTSALAMIGGQCKRTYYNVACG